MINEKIQEVIKAMSTGNDAVNDLLAEYIGREIEHIHTALTEPGWTDEQRKEIVSLGITLIFDMLIEADVIPQESVPFKTVFTDLIFESTEVAANG